MEGVSPAACAWCRVSLPSPTAECLECGRAFCRDCLFEYNDELRPGPVPYRSRGCDLCGGPGRLLLPDGRVLNLGDEGVRETAWPIIAEHDRLGRSRRDGFEMPWAEILEALGARWEPSVPFKLPRSAWLPERL